jgi:hypothetical protein
MTMALLAVCVCPIDRKTEPRRHCVTARLRCQGAAGRRARGMSACALTPHTLFLMKKLVATKSSRQIPPIWTTEPNVQDSGITLAANISEYHGYQLFASSPTWMP